MTPLDPTQSASVRWVIARLRESYGEPERGTPEPILDGVIRTLLAQNTTGVTARRAYATLRERFPTWPDVLAASPDAIAEAIRCAGLAPTRARRMQAILAAVLAAEGELSLERLREAPAGEVAAELTRLPGVGVKTAACVLLFSMAREEFPVDTHIWRIARRLGWVAPAASRDETYRELAPVIPAPDRHGLHVNLIRLGREICRSAVPRCADCPLAARCPTGRERLTAP